MFEHKEEKGIKLPSIVYEKIEKKIIELFCGLGINRLPINPLIGKVGKSIRANIVAVVQKDNKRVNYKIVTVYPDKKEK